MAYRKNRIELIGNLGKDAEKRSTSAGDVVTFSLGENEGTWTDKSNVEHEETNWFKVEVWGPSTKFAATLRKGDLVFVEGRVVTGDYIKDDVKHKTFIVHPSEMHKIDRSKLEATEEATTEAYAVQ